ncbi:helicase-like transcription factor CHR28 isoform X3 [Daucus carota subsp. sativus]|uniref:helicase-like transcription factor CHR28 isoform X3 n=1 Tax=Daucus carota subsp. sativus TaxID=79200 RepID=UPI003082A9BE
MMTFLMYDKNGSLPMSNPFMPRTSPSTAQHASADPGFHSGAGEERYGEYNERLIYQAAFQDLNQPKAEATYPDGQLSVSLLKHQRIALSWMLQKEKSCCCSGGSFLADDQMNQTLLELKMAYCESKGLVDHKQTRFMCKGRRLCCRNTPNDFGIENADVIDAVLNIRGC